MSQRKISTADRISSLPDGVLSHILSFLPTKRAVATSVLSKRWTHLWRSVLTLDFDYYDREWKDLDFDNYDTEEEDRRACSRFNEFVYSVLLSRDAALSIKSFRLNCISYNNLPNVSKWINFVVQRRVEYLHLLADSNDKPKLPISILSCATLVVLKFRGFVVKGFSSVGLPSLKILHLEGIGFPEVRDFMLLLAGCPILEDLQASYIEFDFDSEDSLTCQEFKSFSLSKLTRAVIIGCYCPSLLKALYNVESLRIEIYKMYCCDDDIPTFHYLTRLELFSLNFDWHLLVEVLENCPKLQHLALCQHKVGDSRRIDEDLQENWVDPGFVPQCLSLHLRTCTLLTFLGLRGEFLLARYILKNARVLQTMKFWSRQRSKIKRKLSSCPRASATCQISFPPSVPLFYKLSTMQLLNLVV